MYQYFLIRKYIYHHFLYKLWTILYSRFDKIWCLTGIAPSVARREVAANKEKPTGRPTSKNWNYSQSIQYKVLRMIMNLPWYIRNLNMHKKIFWASSILVVHKHKRVSTWHTGGPSGRGVIACSIDLRVNYRFSPSPFDFLSLR